jgi:hypothetical protein
MAAYEDALTRCSPTSRRGTSSRPTRSGFRNLAIVTTVV